MQLNELPMGLALVLCENVIEDARTGNKSLIGIITNITAERFPFSTLPLTVFISVTGGTGAFTCRLVCEHAGTGKNILDVCCDLDSRSPFGVADVMFAFRSISFPYPGRYSLKVLVDNVLIMSRPLSVSKYEEKTAAQESLDKKDEQ